MFPSVPIPGSVVHLLLQLEDVHLHGCQALQELRARFHKLPDFLDVVGKGVGLGVVHD